MLRREEFGGPGERSGIGLHHLGHESRLRLDGVVHVIGVGGTPS
jgi:hypothetical protein